LLCVLLIIAPTLWVLALGVYFRSDWRRARFETACSQQLGLRVAIGAVRDLRPGHILFEQVTLSDPETDRNLLKFPQLFAFVQPDSLRLDAPQALARVSDVDVFWQLWSTRQAWSLLSAPSHTRLRCHELQLELPDQTHALHNFFVTCERKDKDQANETLVTFRLPGHSDNEHAQLRMLRQRAAAAPPQTTLEFYVPNVPSGELPLALWPQSATWRESLGDRAHFYGRLHATQTAAGWQGELKGHIGDIDLGVAVAGHLRQQLTGRGNLVVRNARFSGGQLQQFAGDLTSLSGGEISLPLVNALAQGLQLGRNFPRDRSLVAYRYTALGLSFHLDRTGFELLGNCRTSGSGLLIEGPDGFQLTDSGEIQPLAALLQTVASGPLSTPATVAQLARVLPLTTMRMAALPERPQPSRPPTIPRRRP
jgi:hypothetical protein